MCHTSAAIPNSHAISAHKRNRDAPCTPQIDGRTPGVSWDKERPCGISGGNCGGCVGSGRATLLFQRRIGDASIGTSVQRRGECLWCGCWSGRACALLHGLACVVRVDSGHNMQPHHPVQSLSVTRAGTANSQPAGLLRRIRPVVMRH